MKVKRTENEVRTDGGEPARMFEDAEVTQVTTADRVRRVIDEALVTPAKIAWSDWRTRAGMVLLGAMTFLGVFTWLYQFQNPANPRNAWVNQPLLWVGSEWLMAEPNALNEWGAYPGSPAYLHAFQSWHSPLGHGPSGNDMLQNTLWTFPFMLKMIAGGAVFTIVMATLVGTVAGYKGGRTESVLMTISDISMSVPALPLVAVLVEIAVANPLLPAENPFFLGVVVVANVWAGLGRTIHSQVLSLREKSYVEASRTMGMRWTTVLRRDILPNLMPYITVNVTYAARRTIYSSVALYYLGILTIGTNWGLMMRRAIDQSVMNNDAVFYWLWIPMVPIILLSMGLILFAQGTDRLFNPRVRTRHEGETEAEDPEADDGGVHMGI